MQEKINQLFEKKNKAYLEFREVYNKIVDECNEELLNVLPYKNKFIKIDHNGLDIYLKVKEMFKHKNLSNEDCIYLRGYGFHFEFTPYEDDTFASWDMFKDYEIKICDIEHTIKKITIITEVEFNKAFNEMINQMRYEHMKELL